MIAVFPEPGVPVTMNLFIECSISGNGIFQVANLNRESKGKEIGRALQDRLRQQVDELVEAAGVEPASENVTGQENYMLSRVHAPGITLGRSRPALRTDKKRVPLA